MKTEFKYYNHLGFFNPFFVPKDGKNHIFNNIDEAIKFLPGDPLIDPVAIIEFLNTNYILGDRSMIQGIQMTPWMARPNEMQTKWKYYKELPSHGEKKADPEEIAVRFHDLLLLELREYIGKRKSIGILLSGGMDSRIAAGLLQEIKNEAGNPGFDVVAITWGLPSSRDVVYAARIAKLYNWEWRHYTVGVEQLEENIHVCAENGCQYSPIHLHAMPQIRNIDRLDCIVAGSFGDSIGRGEYSGKKVSHLVDFSKLKFNRRNGGILNLSIQHHHTEIQKDIQFYHDKFPCKKGYQQAELDHQLHYMRRMLNPCLKVIHHKIPVFQLFTSPAVFGYMWSLDPEIRNDEVYMEMLKKYFPVLWDIPWSRTGLRYPDRTGQPDKFLKKNHNYEEMIREHFLRELAQDDVKHTLERLKVFNLRNIERLIKLCRRFPIQHSRYFEEKLIWILAIAKFFDLYSIKSTIQPDSSHHPVSLVTEYSLRYIKRKL